MFKGMPNMASVVRRALKFQLFLLGVALLTALSTIPIHNNAEYLSVAAQSLGAGKMTALLGEDPYLVDSYFEDQDRLSSALSELGTLAFNGYERRTRDPLVSSPSSVIEALEERTRSAAHISFALISAAAWMLALGVGVLVGAESSDRAALYLLAVYGAIVVLGTVPFYFAAILIAGLTANAFFRMPSEGTRDGGGGLIRRLSMPAALIPTLIMADGYFGVTVIAAAGAIAIGGASWRARREGSATPDAAAS